jgi:serine/threonine protein kinase
MNLPDRTLAHLCEVVTQPDLGGTQYELIDFVGRGGMGAVYRVRDTRLEREVALKVLDFPSAGAEPALAEARLLAQLEHAGIVPVYDAGTLADGRPYYAMRLVDGIRLDVFLRPQRTLSERLSLFEKICEAIAFAHNRGVIHRDLKPENVMVGPFGEVVVLDWGVAIWKEADPKNIAGTPRWMAPEQAAGGPVDRRTDVYALGLILKETLAELAPKSLAAIAARASSPQAEARYASVELMLADLRRYHDQLPVLAYRESLGEKAIRFAARNHVLLLLLATYVAVRVLLFFL